MRQITILLFSACLFWFGGFCAFGQNAQYDSYINKYKGMAVEQMKKYGIPASITLAQGLLESGAGNSRLAKQGNNHFGIKCGGLWKGPYMLFDDDEKNEKFRVYGSARESYEDHSRFLAYGRRYAPLFELDAKDYKGWAHGLKKAGYATNPRYAHVLINIIEKYNLDRYDSKNALKHFIPQYDMAPESAAAGTSLAQGLKVYKCNDNYYVVAEHGDTFESISRRTGVKAKKLRKYNEVDKNYKLSKGDIVYLEKKNKKASRKLKGKYHRVKDGESMYIVCQLYGMQLETLYKVNDLPPYYRAKVGDNLKIR